MPRRPKPAAPHEDAPRRPHRKGAAKAVRTADGVVDPRTPEMKTRPTASSSTFYLSDAKGPPLRQAELRRDPEAFRLSAAVLGELEGRRGASGAKWNWALFERAFVDGVVDSGGVRRWPSLPELAEWSGADREVVKNRASRDEWYRKKRIHEERLPALVDEAVSRQVGERIGDYMAAADEAVAKKSAREYLRSIGEPYLEELMKRVRGDSLQGRITVNATDGERLLRLMLAVEGEATERVMLVGAVQVNVNLQRDATLAALVECGARGLIAEELLPAVLETLQAHVRRVRWRYRVDGAEIADASGD